MTKTKIKPKTESGEERGERGREARGERKRLGVGLGPNPRQKPNLDYSALRLNLMQRINLDSI